MKHCGTQTLETERLILRRYTPDDAEAMFRNWASDKDVTKYLRWQPHPDAMASREVINEWISHYCDERYYHWAIVLKENGGEPIGDIAVMNMKDDTQTAHIGYCLGKKWWRNGIMSETLKTVMDFLFDTVGVNRIESWHAPENPNSGKVMQKCGMKYEGTLRSADKSNQGICDACVYALLRSER